MTGFSRSGPLPAESDEGLFAPVWVRAAVGAAAATAATEALRVLIASVIMSGPKTAPDGSELGNLLALLIPFLFGAGCSVIADLDRPEPRYWLAGLCGAVLAISAVVFAQIWYDAIPLAAATPLALRAILTPPPAKVDRVDFVLSWLFAGAFWPVIIALAGGFVIHNNPGARPLHELVYATGSAAFGAIFTLALVDLDPDRVPEAPAPSVAEAAPAVKQSEAPAGRP